MDENSQNCEIEDNKMKTDELQNILKRFVYRFVDALENKLDKFESNIYENEINITQITKSANDSVKGVGKLFGGPAIIIPQIAKPIMEKFDKNNQLKKALRVEELVTKFRENKMLLREHFLQIGVEIFYIYEQPILSVSKEDSNLLAVLELAEIAANRLIDHAIKNKDAILKSSNVCHRLTKNIIKEVNYNMKKVDFKDKEVSFHTDPRNIYDNVYILNEIENEEKGYRIFYPKNQKPIKLFRRQFSCENLENIEEFEEAQDVMKEIDPRNIWQADYVFYESQKKDVYEYISSKKLDVSEKIDAFGKKFDEHAKKIEDLVGNKKYIGNKLGEVRTKPIRFGVWEPSKYFSGRRKELEDIENKLENASVALISHVTTITGLGGIGKTELAKSYTKLKENHYENILYFIAENQDQLESDFKAIARRLDISSDLPMSDIIKSVYKKCEETGNTLVIFDNVENFEIIREYIPRGSSWKNKPKVLVTSRYRNWNVDEIGEIKIIDLSIMTDNEATEMVQKGLKFEIDNDDEIKKLIKTLQNFPLAIKQAIHYINQQNVNIEKPEYLIADYIEEFEENPADSLDEGINKNEDLYRYTTYNTWNISINRIKKDEKYGDLAINLLEIMSYLYSDAIPIKEIFKTLQPKKRREAINILYNFSMIDLKNGKASIHRLIQEVIKIKLKQENREEQIISQGLKYFLEGANNNLERSQNSLNNYALLWEASGKYRSIIKEFYLKALASHSSIEPLHLLFRKRIVKEENVLKMIETMNELLNEIIDENMKECENLKKKIELLKRNSLHIASQYKRKEVIKYLVKIGSNIDVKNKTGKTPLHIASKFGDVETVDEIIKCGSNLNARDNKNRCVLHFAAVNINHRNVFEYLASKIDDCNISDKDNNTPLHLAAQYGKVEMIESILKNGGDLNRKGKYQKTVLHYAAMNIGNADVLEFFISKGCDVNSCTEFGTTPLQVVAKFGNIKMIKAILKRHTVDLSVRNKFERTILHFAAHNLNNADIFEYLVSNGCDVDWRDLEGVTPLHMAAKFGNVKIVDTILKCNCDLNVKGQNQRSVLHFAARNTSNPDVYGFLVSKGCDIHTCDEDNNTPLHLAALFGNLSNVKSVLKYNENVNIRNKLQKTALHCAVQNINNIDIFMFLVSKGCDVNARDIYNNTPLHLAALYGNIKIIEIILKCNGDLTMKGQYGRTPLHVAAMNTTNSDVFEFLISKGCDVNQYDEDNIRPLSLAVKFGNIKIIETVLKYDGNINVKNKFKQTLLHYAVHNTSNADVFEYLLSKGCDINACDEDNVTPLLQAARFGNIKIIDTILKYNGNLNAKDKYQRTVLHFAALNTVNADVFEFLALKGCDVNSCDVDDDTPFHVAAKFGNMEIIEAIVRNGGDLHFKSKHKHTILHFAAQNINNADIFDFLTLKGCDIHARDEDNNTALHFAAQFGNIQIVDAILKRGGDLTAKGEYQRTVLHFAAMNTNNVDVYDFIASKCCDIHTFDEEINTPLHLAASNENLDVVKSILERDGDLYARNKYQDTVLHFAVRAINIDLVTFLISNGCNFNAYNVYGDTPLHLAALNGNLKTVEFALNLGGDSSAKGECQNSILHFAAQNINNTDIFEFLVSKGCDINACNAFDITPLHVAAQFGNVKMIELILKLGGDLSVKFDNQQTVLHYAAMNTSHADVFEFLVSNKGCDINARDEENNSPLHLAAAFGNIYNIKSILKYNVDLSMKGEYQQTVLHFVARYNSDTEVFDVLVTNGCDVNVCDEENITPLHLAAGYGDIEMVKTIVDHGADIYAVDNSGRNVFDFAKLNTKYEEISTYIYSIKKNLNEK